MENKKGLILKILKIFLLIDLAILLIILGAGFYFYNFVPVKTMSICVSDTTSSLPMYLECSVDKDCAEKLSAFFKNETITEQLDEGMKAKLAEIGSEVIGNLVNTISKDVLKCVNNECKTNVNDFESLLNGEQKECSADEQTKEIKITLSDVLPLPKLLKFTKDILTSSEARTMIKEFIKTGQLPEGLV